MTRAWVAVIGLVGVIGCTDVINVPPSYPSPTQPTDPRAPTTPLPTPRADTIEYRVAGTPTQVVIRFSNSVDGLTQVTSALPYVVTISSTRPSLFLSLEVLPVSNLVFTPYPILSAQIFVNGNLFRESVTTNLNTPIQISGTYRRDGVALSPNQLEKK